MDLQKNIFQELPVHKLRDIARYLEFQPMVDGSAWSLVPESKKLLWLDANRDQLEHHMSWVGSPLFGHNRSYREIVLDTAKKVGAAYSELDETPLVEQAIVAKVWAQAMERMTEAERAKVQAAVIEFAAKHGKQVGKELSGLAALGGAQISGFGIYMLASTMLGAINGALGLGLGFGVFTGMSSLISVIIGPLGWAALGLFTISKLGAPNYRKTIPSIFVIAAYRLERSE